VPLKASVDAAVAQTPSVKDVVVVRRTGDKVAMQTGPRSLVARAHGVGIARLPAEPLDSEHPLFILYTSGTTGKPKGVVHSTAGYLLHAMQSAQWVFDLKDEDTYWCTADIGWVTGHSYVVYGILAAGATSVMYEGAPNHPNPDRLWQIIDDLGVTIFYTAPTAIRAFIKWGEEWPRRHKLDSLRSSAPVGEPINPEAWMWYHRVIGKERCPIVDTWWQTETGGIMISPLPGRHADETRLRDAAPARHRARDPHARRQARRREPGRLPRRHPPVARHAAHRLRRSRPLRAAVLEPAARHLLHRRRRSPRSGRLLLGHGPHRRRRERLRSPARHDGGRERARLAPVGRRGRGRRPARRSQGRGARRVRHARVGQKATDALKKELKEHVAKEIGAFARPDDIRFTDTLPKTRSGKIMRRLLRDIAAGKETLGDTTTLEDYSGPREAPRGGRVASMSSLVLTNTLSGRKEPVRPRSPGHVGVYWCGVTVYAPLPHRARRARSSPPTSSAATSARAARP
jgi:acetyl-CoA synthetase